MTTPILKVTDYLKAWVFFSVVAALVTFVAGFVAGAILGGILGAAGVGNHKINLLVTALTFLMGIPISYYFFRLAIDTFILPKIVTQNNSLPPSHAA
jgi:hypothetical protein